MPLFNVLRTEHGEPLDFMLGCSVPKTEAQRYADKYNNEHPDLVKRRKQYSNSDTPDWKYYAVQVDFDRTKWCPPD